MISATAGSITTALIWSDPDGRLTGVTQGTSSTAYTYDGSTDSFGRLYKVTDTVAGNSRAGWLAPSWKRAATGFWSESAG